MTSQFKRCCNGEKCCNPCGPVLPLQEFHNDKNSHDGKVKRCKDCIKKYHAETSERRKQLAREWRANNPERAREYQRKYRHKNREKLNAQKHNDEYRQYRRKYVRDRRTQKHSLPRRFSQEDEARALEYFHGRCAVCGRPLNDLFGDHFCAMDHWIPLSDTRPNNPGTVPQNMVPLCHGIDGCNNKKSNRDPEEWLLSEFGTRKAKEIIKRIQDYFDTLPPG